MKKTVIKRLSYASMMRFSAMLTVCLFLLDTGLQAGGPIHGAKAGGMGSAFSAVADDASAVAFNPAGLVNLKGFQVYGGGVAVIPSTTYENESGQSERTKSKAFYPPYLYLSHDLGRKDLAIGLGLYSPFGIGGRYWDDDGLTRYVSIESTIATFCVNPVAAWRVKPWLSLAGGPCYLLVKNTAKRMINQSQLSQPDAKFSTDGDGDGWGYTLGGLISPAPGWSIGLYYRNEVKASLSGDAKITGIAPQLQGAFGGTSFKTNMSTDVTFPQAATLGIAWKPNERLTFAFDADWADWNCFEQQKLDFETEVPAAGLTDITVPMDWESSYMYSLGVDYRLTNDLSVRAGYMYGITQVPEDTLSPAAPESDSQCVSLGVGWKIQSNIWLDVFSMAEFYKSRTVHNQILSGRYDNICYFAGVGLGGRF